MEFLDKVFFTNLVLDAGDPKLSQGFTHFRQANYHWAKKTLNQATLDKFKELKEAMFKE